MTAEERVANLPEVVRAKLHNTSLTGLVEQIESYGFESVGGSINLCVHWLELKARIERLGQLIPSPNG